MKRKIKIVLAALAVVGTAAPVAAIPLVMGTWNTKKIRHNDVRDLKEQRAQNSQAESGSQNIDSISSQTSGDGNHPYEYVSGNYATRAAAERALERDATYDYEYQGHGDHWYEDINRAISERITYDAGQESTPILYNGSLTSGNELDQNHLKVHNAHKVLVYNNEIFDDEDHAFERFKQIHGEFHNEYKAPENPIYGSALRLSDVVEAASGWHVEFTQGNVMYHHLHPLHREYAFFESPKRQVTTAELLSSKRFALFPFAKMVTLANGTKERRTSNGFFLDNPDGSREAMGYLAWNYHDGDVVTSYPATYMQALYIKNREDKNLVSVHFWTDSPSTASAVPYTAHGFMLPERPINAPLVQVDYTKEEMKTSERYSENPAATSRLDELYDSKIDEALVFDGHYFLKRDELAQYIKENSDRLINKRAKPYVIINGRKFKTLQSAKDALLKPVGI